jgi:hypothetical protein
MSFNLPTYLYAYKMFYVCRAGVVQRITESGLALNKYCYAALIAAEKNQAVKKNDTFEKVQPFIF